MWGVWDVKSILSLLYSTLSWYFSLPYYMDNPVFPRPMIRDLSSGSQRQELDVCKFYIQLFLVVLWKPSLLVFLD